MPRTVHAALPPDDPLRQLMHDEVHARPSARIHFPALVVYVAVFNDGVSREQECALLRELPGHEALQPSDLQGNFQRLKLPEGSLRWERHTEFTRYTLFQALPPEALPGSRNPDLLSALAVPDGWLSRIPGRTFAAIELAMVEGEVTPSHELLARARQWLGDPPMVVASHATSSGSAMLASDLYIREDGFERMLVVAPPGTSAARAGRLSQRLLEIETYRLMALRGLPVAKQLGPELTEAETRLADITSRLDSKTTSDQELLDTLVSLATRIERATAQHAYRFSATRAYDTLVNQRIAELREQAIPGTQTLGEFMQRRLSPAIATVAATAQRLASLSERVARTSALLRTRVDIVTEAQNQLLLEKLTRGQELQLRLQATVEGLSIAAISYYVVSLVFYAAKAGKVVGLPVLPELAAGVMIPVVIAAVWFVTRRIHRGLYDHG